jgi:hypothetical protein
MSQSDHEKLYSMNYINMIIKPLISMWDNLFLLLPASGFAIGLTIIQDLTNLAKVESALVVGLLALIMLDLISGVYKAMTDRKIVTSLGLRQTSIKIFEYALALLGFVIVANMAGMEWIKTSAFIWLAFIEMKSIVENLADKRGIINELYDIIKKRFTDINN